jgi:hypothetical protein
MEIITFLLGIFGFIIAYITYINTYKKEPEEDKQFVIALYDHADTATRRLIRAMEDYADRHQCYQDHFKDGLSFEQGLAFLYNARTALFTNEHRQALVTASMGKMQLNELTARIQTHREGVDALHTYLKFYFLKDFSVGVPK